MDEPGGVHGVHGPAELARDGQRIGGARRPALLPQRPDPLRQRAPVGEFEHEEGLLPLALADVVDGDHVRARDPSQRAALGDEPLPDLGVEAVVLGEDLVLTTTVSSRRSSRARWTVANDPTPMTSSRR